MRYLKQSQNCFLPEKVIIIKKKSDNYQGSMWGMVYRQDEYKSTTNQENKIY